MKQTEQRAPKPPRRRRAPHWSFTVELDGRLWCWVARSGGRVVLRSPRLYMRPSKAWRALHQLVDSAVEYARDEVPF